MVVIQLDSNNKCPVDCPHYDIIEIHESVYEVCYLPDGKYVIEVKNGKLVRCPLGKWSIAQLHM